MKSISEFFSSNVGRVLRAAVGIVLTYLGLLVLNGVSQVLIILIAIVFFTSALFDTCGLGLLTHRGIKGSKIRTKNDPKEVRMTTMAILLLGIVSFASLGYLINKQDPYTNTGQAETISSGVTVPTENVDQAAKESNAQTQDDMLIYLIEEEKLAHDVYTVMYQKYGAKVFGNILNSEETHQDRVLALLQARNIADPRSSEIGVFTNPELQALYNKLIEQGNLSEVEAYKVGVAIEEKDIADITTQLATATDADIVSTLEDLRSGSESHLRAFNRQLGSY